MLIIQSYSSAILLCFLTMLCWGSWANTQKMKGSHWPFSLFYWDYILGILLFSGLFGLTLGSTGTEGRSFLPDLGQANPEAVISAFSGGVIFNLANLLLGVAIEVAGLAVAFPVGIGIALVLGVAVNYLGDPQGDPLLLGLGVGAIMLAIVLSSVSHFSMKRTSAAGSKGIVLSVVSGLMMGLFYRFVAASMATSFEIPETGLLTNYSGVFVFSVGIFASGFLWNTWFMVKPVSGPPSTYRQWLGGSFKDHLPGIIGGCIWCLGFSVNLMASNKAGTAASYGLGQGATMVAAAWGVFLWKEFKGASPSVNRMLAGMFLFYLAGIGLIILSN
jgi:glucose uptake protein